MCEAIIPFETLTREIEDFPKRVRIDSTYYVHTWGDDLSAECWFYATHGIRYACYPSVPVRFAALLHGMFPKFMDRVNLLGFTTCSHVTDTWWQLCTYAVRVTWEEPEEFWPERRFYQTPRTPVGSVPMTPVDSEYEDGNA